MALRLLDDIATAEQQQGSLGLYSASADYSSSCRSLVLTVNRVSHHCLAKLLHEAVIATDVVEALGRGRLEAGQQGFAGREQLAQLRRHVRCNDPVAFALRHHLHAQQVVEYAGHERLHGLRVADRFVNLAKIGLDLVRFDRVLSEDATRRFLTGGGLVQLVGDGGLGRGGLLEVAEVKQNALRVSLGADRPPGVEQQRLRNGVDDALRVLRKRHVDTGGTLDFLHFA